MTICAKCGEEFPEKYRFCPGCGASVASAMEALGSPGAPGSGVEGASDQSMGFERTVVRGEAERVTIDECRVTNGESERRTSDVEDRSMGFERTVMGGQRSEGGGQSSGGTEELRSRYELLEEIGRGGFARVWRARDRKLDRFVAVKRLIDPVVKDANWDQTLRRFHQEARVIASLGHRNIVGVYDVGMDAEGDYIVMELVQGGSLREYLHKKGKLPEAEALELVKGIAQGLGFAHKKNLVHRDIKPANILLQGEGDSRVPKIVDFGLARVGSDSELSMSGYGMGTLNYMPPEQRRNAKGVNHTADIYALGKTLYEMLTGDVPDQVDPEKLAHGLAKVILKCVKSDPEERYFSMEEFLKALEGSKSGGPVRAGVSASMQNPCPSCGVDNAIDVRFCEGCGAGLTRLCPECGKENSIHKTFCGGCGTDVPAMLAAGDVLGRMRRYAEQKKWSRVRKEHTGLPARDKLRGDKAIVLLEEADRLDRDAGEYAKQRDKKNEELRGCMDAGDFHQALVVLEESLKLDPYQEDLKKLKAEDIPARIDESNRWKREQECDRLHREVADLLAEGYLVEAVSKLRAFQKLYPEASGTIDLEEQLVTMGVEGLCRQFDTACEEKDYTEADALLAAAVEMAPKLPVVIRRREDFEIIRRRFQQRTSAAGSVQELDKILGEWPGFPGVAEKRDRWLVRAKQRKKLLLITAGVVLTVMVLLGLSLLTKLRHYRHRNANANREAPLNGYAWRSPATGMEFVWIPAVRMWVGKYEVTNGEYRRHVPGHNSGAYERHSLNSDRQPVVMVNFNEALAYAAWMTERDRRAGWLPAGFRYRLPTEAEWETFAKAGNNWEYPWGNNWPPVSGRAGNYGSIPGYNDGHAVTAPVEQSWENPWGLFGVGGNVWEMTASDASNESFGAWRGGSWRLGAGLQRVSYSDTYVFSNNSDNRSDGLGFRLMLSR